MRRAVAILTALALLLSARPAAASAMPEAPNCPIYPSDDVWHSLVQGLPVLPQSDTWIANMGGPSRLLHPDFGAYPYGHITIVDPAYQSGAVRCRLRACPVAGITTICSCACGE